MQTRVECMPDACGKPKGCILCAIKKIRCERPGMELGPIC